MMETLKRSKSYPMLGVDCKQCGLVTNEWVKVDHSYFCMNCKKECFEVKK